MNKPKIINPEIINDLVTIIETAKSIALHSVDFHRVQMYWNIGKRIFEEEQEGKERADYGKFLIKYLSENLQANYGSGYSYRQLNWYRQFYRTFPIVSALRTQLSWTQYKALLKIDNQDKREFYIEESSKNNWSSRQYRKANKQQFIRKVIDEL